MPALAETPISAAEFDAYTRGKTMFYGRDGVPYGAEQYLPNRRVIWTFLDGECQEGTWFAEGEQICFDYGNGSPLQCWRFFLNDGRLSAQFEDGTTAMPLIEVEQTPQPLWCPGPKVGV
ncbi:hypothetical protein HA397_26590 [Escherichia coli]|nr:hypothetical protein [Escherichia coli]